MSPRHDRAAKNSRWYVIAPTGHRRIGWGDVSYTDLRAIHNEIGHAVFVAVRERPNSDSDFPWAEYSQDDPVPGPLVKDVCEQAVVAVMAEGGPVIVTSSPTVLDETRAIAVRYGIGAITSSDLQLVAAALSR